MFSELAAYVRGVHDHNLPDQEGMVYMVWQDFEITLQRSGDLLWKRGLHTIRPGIPDINYIMPETNGKDSFACVPENTIEYIKQALTEIQQGPPIQSIIEKYHLEVRTEGTKSIIRVPDGMTVPEPYIKGLIFNEKGTVVCPGVIIPEDITTVEQFDYEAGSVVSIEPAYDGVLFRVYYDAETATWSASTNGQITAKNGWGGRSFDALFKEITHCIDYSVLNKAYCYYVIMEHPEHINIVPHFKARLILVDVVTINRPFRPVNIQAIEGFTHVLIRQPVDQVMYTGRTLFDLAENYKIGLVVGLKSGGRVRIESVNFRHMSSLRPNIADVYKQWIHKLRRPTSSNVFDEIISESERDIVEYLNFFTWHTEKFNYMRERFFDIFGGLCRKIAERKEIIPKRLMKFYRELTPDERTPERVLRKLIDADEKHLFYLMNPYNVLDF